MHIFILEPPIYFVPRCIHSIYRSVCKSNQRIPHACCFPLKPRERHLIFAVDCFGVPICCGYLIEDCGYKNRIGWLTCPPLEALSCSILNLLSNWIFIYAAKWRRPVGIIAKISLRRKKKPTVRKKTNSLAGPGCSTFGLSSLYFRVFLRSWFSLSTLP